MPTLRSAFLCASLGVIMFSCKSKDKENAGNVPVIKDAATTSILPNETVDISSFQKKFLESATQHFSISSKQVSLLRSKGGLKITVDPGSLEKADGSSVNGNIQVSVIELKNVHDLFKSNAATVSNGKLLASGGSYFIGMDNKGEKLHIKKGRTLQVEFPVLKKEQMELFYGERNESNDMNWKPANAFLQKTYESVSFTDRTPWELMNDQSSSMEEWVPAKVYRSLNEEVFYYKTKMTLAKLVDTINKYKPKVYLQTISFWPKNIPTDRKLDTNFLTSLYGPRKQYILKTCKELEQVEALKNKNYLPRDTTAEQRPRSLAGQIQKYYAPSNITALGWINCDRFYNPSQETETNLDLPYAFNRSRLEYFIVFKSFNGLLNNRADFDENQKVVLKNLPVGEEVTFIAFIKKNGILYQCRQDFVVGKNKTLAVNFKEISAAEMNRIFGSNAKI